MADEKKVKREELTDEQANAAAGGIGYGYIPRYKCQGGCGQSYDGTVPFYVGSRPYCVNCYAKYQQSQSNYIGRPDHHERP